MVAKLTSEQASSEEKIGLITAHESCTSAAEPSDTRMMGGSSTGSVLGLVVMSSMLCDPSGAHEPSRQHTRGVRIPRN